jgi:all-trans-8'-apo-beta-carotenal 15,15'-oxygenase
MKRRDFTAALLAAAAAPALRAAGGAAPAWTAGYAGLQADLPPLAARVQGRWPAELNGALLRNGTGRHELGGLRYRHPFDGDGFVQRYTVAGGRVVHEGRFVRTPKFVADSAAGRPVREAFDTPLPGGEPIGGPDAMNAANTSVLAHAGALYALWEGGSATQLDPATLQTRGPKVWSPETAGLPFSAHPRLDADGTLWNFGIAAAQQQLLLWRVDARGTLVQHAALPLPDAPMVHDFAVTERHLVFVMPPFVFERERFQAGHSFLDSHVWRPALGLRVLVLPKDRLDAPRWFGLPPGFVFHLGNAWDDGATVRLDCWRTPDAFHATEGLRRLMRGEHVAQHYATLQLLALDLARGQASATALPASGEFPRIDPRVAARRHREVFAAARVDPGDRPGYDGVQRVDLEQGTVDRFHLGRHMMVEEHVVVPGARHAWLVGSALDLQAQAMQLLVFDARRLADGPVARATVPRVVPLGLHGSWLPA